MNLLHPDTPRNVLFQKGTILWRGAEIEDDRVTLNDTYFELTPKGSYVCRVALNGNCLHELEVYGNRDSADSEDTNKGQVVFLDKLPPLSWTHLVIEGVSKKLRENPLDNPMGNGCAIFAKVGAPFETLEYEAFRHEIYTTLVANQDTSNEELFAILNKVWPMSAQKGDKRLVYFNDEIPMYDYLVHPGVIVQAVAA